jgi:hypothetical protein
MSQAHAIVRSLLVYSVVLPLAIFVGYLLATPDNLSTLRFVGGLLFVLTIPFLLRHHQLLVILCWQTGATVFFLKGNPPFWLLFGGLSFGFSVFRIALNREMRFIPTWTLFWPLLLLTMVALGTAFARGGLGLASLGGGNHGGARYLYLLGGVMGFFALTAQPIPAGQHRTYTALFFLSGLLSVISIATAWTPPPWQYFLMFFPADSTNLLLASNDVVATLDFDPLRRFGCFAVAGQAGFVWLLAHYGIRGVLQLRCWWRLCLLLTCIIVSLLGGFRSTFILMTLLFATLFVIEGLWRTAALPVVLAGTVMLAGLVLPNLAHFPNSVQRALSFLPVEVDAAARLDAQASTEWRLRIWRNVIPEVPRYLLVGKGYTINPQEIEIAQSGLARTMDSTETSLIAGDYHNGPLSVIVPLGVGGCIAILWLFGAGIHLLTRNFRRSPPELRNINAALLAFFITKCVFFLFVFGSLYSELFQFTGLLGLGVALNADRSAPTTNALTRPLPLRARRTVTPTP